MATAKSTRAQAAQFQEQPADVLASPEQRQVPEEGDAEFITHTGSIGAVRKHLGVQVTMPENGEPVAVVDARGAAWELSGTDAFAVTIRRPRAPAEREAWIDWHNAKRVCYWFSQDRLRLCRLIATEVMAISEQLARAPRPRMRRKLRRQLLALGSAQWALVSRERVDMPAVRAELSAAVGVQIQQANYAEAA